MVDSRCLLSFQRVLLTKGSIDVVHLGRSTMWSPPDGKDPRSASRHELRFDLVSSKLP